MPGITFDDDLQQYVCEYKGILFSWDDEPAEYEEQIEKLAEVYWNKLDSIARYISADLEEMYGAHSIEQIKEKLGQPNIDPDRGEINYLEHTFDEEHIFTLEYMDDDLEELSYFIVNG